MIIIYHSFFIFFCFHYIPYNRTLLSHCEDFISNPLWTRDELLGYLRVAIRAFSEQTGLVDRNEIRIVDGTTGEADVPDDFTNSYYNLYNQAHVDSVRVSDLDFITSGWISGVTGTPLGCTVYGSGPESKIRFVPVQ